MRSARLWFVLLCLAGVHDCGMAAYHLVLPWHMGWRQGVGDAAHSLVWALFALNYSWSVLLFLTGCLVFYAARLGPLAGSFPRRTVFTVGLFWVLHGAYTFVSPLPLPPSLWLLRYALGVFPVVVVALHWAPLVVYRGLAREPAAK